MTSGWHLEFHLLMLYNVCEYVTFTCSGWQVGSDSMMSLTAGSIYLPSAYAMACHAGRWRLIILKVHAGICHLEINQ